MQPNQNHSCRTTALELGPTWLPRSLSQDVQWKSILSFNKMDLLFCLVAFGAVVLLWSRRRPELDTRTISKRKVVRIPLTPYHVSHKSTQTLSPVESLSEVSSLDFTTLPDFFIDEQYLERDHEEYTSKCVKNPITGTTEFHAIPATTTVQPTGGLMSRFLS